MPKGNKTEQDKKILQGKKRRVKEKNHTFKKPLRRVRTWSVAKQGKGAKMDKMNKTSTTLLHCNKKRNLKN
jgi:hypothetical protein